jgi:ketosteroid isomerase-like protein
MKTSLIASLSLAALLGLYADNVFASENRTKPQKEIAVLDEAKIKAEVTKTMADFISAIEKVDLAGVLSFTADVPEFCYADPEGNLQDHAAYKQGHAEWFAQCSAQRILAKSQEISVLGPDAALVKFHGAYEAILTDGSVLRVEPTNVALVFKRIGGAWKFVYQHESGPPPQPVHASDEEAAIRRADTELVAAANAHDVDRWMKCFAPEAKMMPPNEPPIVGAEAIRKVAVEMMAIPEFAVVHRLEKVEVSRSGDMGWVSYSFELTVRDANGRPVTQKGKDISLYRKASDGSWKVIVDIWSEYKPTE